MLKFEKSLTNEKIFITGHTGFTSSWICTWLNATGTKDFSFSLSPETHPSLFVSLNFQKRVLTVFGNIYKYEQILKAMEKFQPNIVFHLATQPLFRKSYNELFLTFSMNTIGTENVPESARMVKSVLVVLRITIDKNNERLQPYCENNKLEGENPYGTMNLPLPTQFLAIDNSIVNNLFKWVPV